MFICFIFISGALGQLSYSGRVTEQPDVLKRPRKGEAYLMQEPIPAQKKHVGSTMLKLLLFGLLFVCRSDKDH